MQHLELIWILDGDKTCVTLYQQTLGLQYRLRIIETLEDLAVAIENLPRTVEAMPLLIADPDTTQGSLGEFFRRRQNSGQAVRLPECMIISKLDDLNLMRFYLKSGVRDYLLKPIRPNELVAKVEKALQAISQSEIQILRNDLDGQEVKDLTFREHQLLTLFLSRPDRAVKRDELYDAIWSKVTVNRKTLDVHLFNLRRKLRPHGYDIVCLSQLFTLSKQVSLQSETMDRAHVAE